MIINKLLDWLLPVCCDLCHGSVENACLCQTCRDKITKTTPCCQLCQAGLEIDGTCGACITLQPKFDKVYTLGDYQTSLSDLITGLKFHGKLNHSRTLSELWIKHLPGFYQNDKLPELIISVPLHKNRLKQRGFNQAVEIARPIAKKFKLSLDKFSCIRIKATKPQLSLPPKERQHNVAGAFAIKKSISASHVAIVDDVFTTGYTVNALATLLKQQGIKRIDVWCCARTQLR